MQIENYLSKHILHSFMKDTQVDIKEAIVTDMVSIKIRQQMSQDCILASGQSFLFCSIIFNTILGI